VNLKVISLYLSYMIFLMALLLVFPIALAYVDGSALSFKAYLATLVVALIMGSLLYFLGRGSSDDIHRKDAFGIVAFIWLVLGVLGGLPFYLEGSIDSIPSALFEAVSGFTTTGATVVANVDGLSRATNLWRCLSHWIGGMGIVVLFVAVFPQLGVGAKHLFKSEVAGPTSEGLKPRIKQTALRLWWIYTGLTALCGVLLYISGFDWFEAVCHAFSILSTGGFSTKSTSIGGFKNEWAEWITIVFMLIGGLNFGLYYTALIGKVSALWKSFELRFYIALNLVVASVIALYEVDRYGNIFDSFRYASFQTLAVSTTTGLMTDDFDSYAVPAKFLLFICMFIGGCAGSTAGGIKASRVVIAFKTMVRELKIVVNPVSKHSVRIGSTFVDNVVVSSVLIYIAAYFFIFFIASSIMIFLGMDFTTGMSSVIACLSSVGPGFGGVGPLQNYEFISGIGKIVLCFCMIAGRLEIFVFLAIFNRSTWSKR
jgi:trk system potassium uptake protein TrkH